MKIRHISPQKCMFGCGRACYTELPICKHCLHRLNRLLCIRCKSCGKQAGDCTCYSKVKGFLFFYETLDSKWLIYQIKNSLDKDSLDFLIELLIKAAKIDIHRYDGVTYVPRSRRNRIKYGYDQSKQIARSISRLYSIPLVKTLKRKGGNDQKLLSGDQRFSNTKNRFIPYKPTDMRYDHLLLVDDVTTTSATLMGCSAIIRKHFADSVTPLVLAQTNLSKKTNGG